ncbi:MAG: hypothetical protein ACJ76H_09885 [Bacteriovoracaceae bacterium]
MRWRKIFGPLGLLIAACAIAQTPQVNLPSSYKKPVFDELKPFYSPSEGQTEDLLKGDVVSVGKVDSPTNKQQQMMLFVSGIHPRNCTRAMRKLSLYENYSSYMDFIKESKYDEKTQKLSFVVDHALLPFPMVVGFKIPRITKEGHYPFVFEDGFLKDLKGTVIVKEVGKFCLMGLKADWRGPESKIPNVVFGTFVQTVGKLGLERLIRVSLF